jgi:hypothetical protein
VRNITAVYVKGNANSFEKHVPLKFVGQRNLSLGFSNDIDILFLEGFELLDDAYKSSLKELGYKLHDVREIYLEIFKEYSSLYRFSDFNQKCFLRWPVINKLYSGENIIHYDADIVFNEDPIKLGSLLDEKTFVLQGCPALTCISDSNWHLQYENNLKVYSSDINKYSQKAWIERKDWELSEMNKWAGQRNKKLISSDQDLISHLIHTDRLPQDNPIDILNCMKDYILIENPLYIHAFSPWCDQAPFEYKRVNNIDFINNKKVAFWHMQSDFVNYLIKYSNSANLIKLLGIRLPNDLEYGNILTPQSFNFPNINSNKFKEIYDKLLNISFRVINKTLNTKNRLDMYRYFFEKDDFGSILNNKVWWKGQVFINKR